eukprot:TRINITY_DN102370_c0_g1_i1.p1 TRINITY_DN102370_c0_g1~~TRINITY_DN102370_c0_g1_i1.p1  ORF type:complete len:549 (+),score=113.73 TRINITY_DN102370_c0_g1_i1:253-1899(+)
MAAVIAAELCRPAKQVCAEGPQDLATSAQEVVILTLAFSVGWYIFRPLMHMIKSHAGLVNVRNNNQDKPVSRRNPTPRSQAESCEPSPMSSTAANQAESPTINSMVKEMQPAVVPPGEHGDGQRFQERDCQGDDVQLARTHAQNGRPDLAVDLWMEVAAAASQNPCAAEQGSMPQPELYAAALEACAECNDFDSAYRLASSADWSSSTSSVPGQAAHLALARWLARRQDLANANNCVETVRRCGGHVDVRTLRTLCVACARAGELATAAAYFSEISKVKGLDPGFNAFSAMVRGLSVNGEPKQAMTYLQQMVRHGLRPDAMVFDTILESCANQNLLNLAQEVLQTMEDLNVHPSNATLAAQLRLYASRGDLLKAWAAFEDLPKKHDFEPNAYVYGVLISACLAHGRADWALQAYARMTAAGCFPNAQTYESLVRVSLKFGEFEKAVSLVDEAMCLQKPPRDAGTSQQAPLAQTMIDAKVVEELLTLLGRRHEAKRLGLPLLHRLEAANFEVSESLVEALVRAAKAEETQQSSERQQRRARFDQWRRFH